ncbi:MAG TPA: hypothetical protein VK563_20370 [Puia sp.]|nr:hypothetical protein [Puia sp.]
MALPQKQHKELLLNLETFYELVPVRRFINSNMKILLNYLKREHEFDYDDWLIDHIKDMENLVMFLEAIEENVDQSDLQRKGK